MRKMSIIPLNTKYPIVSYYYKREPFSGDRSSTLNNATCLPYPNTIKEEMWSNLRTTSRSNLLPIVRSFISCLASVQ